MFQVLDGNRDSLEEKKMERENRKKILWLRYFANCLADYYESGKRDPEKAVYSGARCFLLDCSGDLLCRLFRKKDESEERCKLVLFNTILELFAKMSPEQIAQMFPPAKVYDGARYGEIDYFDSMEAVEKYGGKASFAGDADKAMEFLMSVNNLSLRLFLVTGLSIINQYRMAEEGREDLASEFFSSELGKDIPVYHMADGNHGKILVDENGRKIGNAVKPFPRYIKRAK